MCDSIDFIATRLEGAADLKTEIQAVLQEIMTEHGQIVFNGDGYSAEWHEEAERRGLPCLRTTADALPVLTTEPVIDLFERYGVLTERELESRLEIYSEQYCAHVNVEANLVVEMAKTQIYPSAMRYLGELAGTATQAKSLGLEPDLSTIESLQALVGSLEAAVGKLESAHAAATHEPSSWAFEVLPAMLEVRGVVDALERVVADDLWPLPTYQEMLFLK